MPGVVSGLSPRFSREIVTSVVSKMGTVSTRRGIIQVTMAVLSGKRSLMPMDAKHKTQEQAAGVAHKDGGGIPVVDEEADAGRHYGDGECADEILPREGAHQGEVRGRNRGDAA